MFAKLIVLLTFCALPLLAAPEAAPEPEPAAKTAPVVGSMELEAAARQASGTLEKAVERLTGKWGQATFMSLELWRYLTLLVGILLTLVVARLVKYFLEKYASRMAAKTSWKADDMMFEAAGRPASLFVSAVGFWIALLPISVKFPIEIQEAAARCFMAVAAGAVLWYIYLVAEVIDHYLRKLASRTDNDLDDTFVDIMRKTLRLFIVAVGVMFIGQTILNLKITGLLASAGIAGLAIAFAAQDTIANFFGSFMVLLDRPFKVGERVQIEGADGVIEEIGFRSTRIRTLDGHLVSLPNKMVADGKVVNVGRRPHIKRVSNITITYDTPVDKVEKAVQIIRDILENHRGMDPELPPRVYFSEFNDWSLNLIMIAWYHPANYWEYLEWCQETNLRIMRGFEAEGIEFAFPTSTTYLAHDSNRPLTITTHTTV